MRTDMFFQVNASGEKLSSIRCYQRLQDNKLQHCLITCTNKFTIYREAGLPKGRDNNKSTEYEFIGVPRGEDLRLWVVKNGTAL